MGKVGRPRGTKYKLELTDKQREDFRASQTRGTHSARVLRRMRILLLIDEGVDQEEISKNERVSQQTVRNTLKRFVITGRINDLPRSGRPEKFSGEVKAHIIATACTDAPKGRSRWTLRLLAKEVVQLQVVDTLSRTTVGRILKKTN